MKNIFKRLLFIVVIPIFIIIVAIISAVMLLLTPFYWIITGENLLEKPAPKWLDYYL